MWFVWYFLTIFKVYPLYWSVFHVTVSSPCCISTVTVQSDWGRFLYGSVSLCYHPDTVGVVNTLTVVISCIFSLDSTDGQSEVTPWSTATESRWYPRVTGTNEICKEFRRFSEFLLIPGQPLSMCITVYCTAGLTAETDWVTHWNSFHCRSLGHCDLASGLWNRDVINIQSPINLLIALQNNDFTIT